jgi:hypothetical protein
MKTAPEIRRRAFLGGAGAVALGLPWLEAFAPRKANALDTETSRFIVIVHQANGVAQSGRAEPTDYFWPTKVGALDANFLRNDGGRTLVELAGFADRMLAIRGLRYGFTSTSCSHVDGFNQMLTGCQPHENLETRQFSATSESIDCRIARQINAGGREPLSLIAPAKDGMVISPSYRGPKQPLSVDTNPWAVYQRIVGLSSTDEVAASQIARRRKSVNDLVRVELKALLSRGDLSREDRRRLDLHFSAVRDVEVKLACTLGDFPQNELDEAAFSDWRNLETIAKLHMDLIALSCACDYSRVATLSIGGCSNNARFVLPGYPGSEKWPYHGISHRAVLDENSREQSIEHAQEMHHQIDRWHARLFTYLLDRLAAYSVGEESLLDHGVAIWTNELANGPHESTNVPWILVGSAGGKLKQGVCVDVGDVTHNRLLNTLLNTFGVRQSDGRLIDDFGSATLEKGQLDAIVV